MSIIKKYLALLLVTALLLGVFVHPVAASEESEGMLTLPPQTDVESEEYRARFTSDAWQSAGETGAILRNGTDGITLDILGRDAGLWAELLPYEGETACNALQLSLENQSACTELQIEVTYQGGERTEKSTLRLQAQSEQQTYYAYFDDVNAIEEIRLTFLAVSDGEITLYSLSRVSFYHQLTDDKIHGSITECYYDTESGNIVISGRLRSESVIKFSGGSIMLYRLTSLRGDNTINASAKPLQTLKVSNRFTFVVPTANFAARNNRYALVLVDAKGNRTLMSEPCYPVHRTPSSMMEAPDAAYKGVIGEDLSDAMRTYAGSVVIDVYLDELLARSEEGSASFAYDEQYFFFHQTYVDALKRQITPFYQLGTQVYLRLLIRANEAGYALPYTVSAAAQGMEQAPTYLAVMVQTLDERRAYAATLQYLLMQLSDDSEQIAGVILGCGVDNSLQNHYAGMLSMRDYMQLLVAQILLTSNVLNLLPSSVKLYLPVTDTEYPSYYTSYDLDGVYATPMLLDGVSRILNDVGLGSFVYYPLVETSASPLDEAQSDDEWAEQIEKLISNSGSSTKLLVEKISEDLSAYDSVGANVSVIWTPLESCGGMALSLSYLYLYYTLQDAGVDTFFTVLNRENADDLRELIARIDTATAAQITEFAHPYFGEALLAEWQADAAADQTTFLYMGNLTEDTRTTYAGRYLYWNFAAAIGTLQWSSGFGCQSLAADGGSQYGRALLAELSGEENGGMIQYRFREPENLALCDALALSLAVTDAQGTPVSANVYLTLYGEHERTEAVGTVQPGALNTLTLSGTPLKVATSCRAISIRLEPLDGAADQPLRLYLVGIEGLSRRWDDDTLQQNILEQREKRAEGGEAPTFGLYPVLLLTALLLLTIAGAILTLKRAQKRKNSTLLLR